ncbi:MAG: hypothetical protein KGJ86_00530 [Chloroflexota bacterium]|nr:hypothetical protein [Chloroflexota bacterium]
MGPIGEMMFELAEDGRRLELRGDLAPDVAAVMAAGLAAAGWPLVEVCQPDGTDLKVMVCRRGRRRAVGLTRPVARQCRKMGLPVEPWAPWTEDEWGAAHPDSGYDALTAAPLPPAALALHRAGVLVPWQADYIARRAWDRYGPSSDRDDSAEGA